MIAKEQHWPAENPSVNILHREWVPPEVETVRQALAWRTGTEELPEVQIAVAKALRAEGGGAR